MLIDGRQRLNEGLIEGSLWDFVGKLDFLQWNKVRPWCFNRVRQ